MARAEGDEGCDVRFDVCGGDLEEGGLEVGVREARGDGFSLTWGPGCGRAEVE